eukprot:6938006-Prymnesium_polylepis.2
MALSLISRDSLAMRVPSMRNMRAGPGRLRTAAPLACAPITLWRSPRRRLTVSAENRRLQHRPPHRSQQASLAPI